MKKIGILGLGIGSMYYKLLHQFFEVVTVDINTSKQPTYTSLDECIEKEKHFDLFIIATPNYLHKEQVYQVIDISEVVLVEKPGLVFLDDYLAAFKRKRNVFMTKNNMWREEFPFIRKIILDEYRKDNVEHINITWINKSRVPFPGHWFTEKSKSFGGTSKDSFPHLLSEFYYLFNSVYPLKELTFEKEIKQNFTLEQVTDTDYGTVNPDGIYDVDDYCRIDFNEIPVSIIGCWKSTTGEDTKIGMEMILKDGKKTYFDFSLCPEYAYFRMFNYFLNLDETERSEQFNIDSFIHSIIEKL